MTREQLSEGQRTRSKRVSALAVAVLTLVGVGLGSVNASAADLGSSVLRSWSNGRCLDSNAAGNVYALSCNGGQYQSWQQRYPNGYTFRNCDNLDAGCVAVPTWKLIDNATNRCLDSNSNGDVYTNPCQPSNPYQAWTDAHGVDSGFKDDPNVHQYINFETDLLLIIGKDGSVKTFEEFPYTQKHENRVDDDIKRGM